MVALGRPRQRALERGFASGPDGDYQSVVGQPLAGARDRRARPVVDRGERAAEEARAQVPGNGVEAVTLRMPARERLCDRHRPVDELFLRGQQRALDAFAGQVTQREQRLQSGDATAGDQDPKRARRRGSHGHTTPGTAARSSGRTSPVEDRREAARASNGIASKITPSRSRTIPATCGPGVRRGGRSTFTECSLLAGCATAVDRQCGGLRDLLYFAKRQGRPGNRSRTSVVPQCGQGLPSVAAGARSAFGKSWSDVSTGCPHCGQGNVSTAMARL